jgi:aminomethyltransferase
MKAFRETDVFYYQGTKLIGEVETLLTDELRRFLGCSEVEARVISGQMANAAVFSGIVDYLNRLDREKRASPDSEGDESSYRKRGASQCPADGSVEGLRGS